MPLVAYLIISKAENQTRFVFLNPSYQLTLHLGHYIKEIYNFEWWML